jgi:hypothetical protein
MTKKEDFLKEHNRLSPLNLQADLSLLDKFKEAKASLFKKNDWSVDKLRRPFIIWLSSLSMTKKKSSKKSEDKKDRQSFNIYPREEA